MAFEKNQWNINGIVIGSMLSANVLSPYLSFIPNGIVLLIVLPFLYLFYKNYRCILESNLRPLIILVIYILVFFIYSLVLGGFRNSTFHCLLDFLLFGIPFLIVSYLKVNIKYIFKTLSIIGVFAIPIQLLQIDFSDTSDAGTWMMVSYNIVKIAIASVISITYDESILIKIVSFINIVVSVVYLTYLGSRGAILGCIVAVLLMLLYRKNKQLQLLSFKTMMIAVSIALFVSSFSTIVLFIYDILKEYGISSYSLERIVAGLNSQSSLSSGRDELYEIALRGIEENVFMGQGIASFDNFSGEYPHNLIIQMLYEGGFFLGMPLVFLTFFSLSTLNSKLNHQARLLHIYLFSAGVVQLIFSSYFWMSILFWYWIGLGLKRIKI